MFLLVLEAFCIWTLFWNCFKEQSSQICTCWAKNHKSQISFLRLCNLLHHYSTLCPYRALSLTRKKKSVMTILQHCCGSGCGAFQVETFKNLYSFLTKSKTGRHMERQWAPCVRGRSAKHLAFHYPVSVTEKAVKRPLPLSSQRNSAWLVDYKCGLLVKKNLKCKMSFFSLQIQTKFHLKMKNRKRGICFTLTKHFRVYSVLTAVVFSCVAKDFPQKT